LNLAAFTLQRGDANLLRQLATQMESALYPLSRKSEGFSEPVDK
jgi:hypothetical protein